MKNFDEYFKSTSSLVTGFVLFLFGIVLFFLNDRFYFLLMNIFIYLFLIIGIKDFIFYFFQKKKDTSFSSALFHFLFALFLSLHPNISYSILPIVVGFYFLVNAVLQGIDFIILIQTKDSGKIAKGFYLLFYLAAFFLLVFFPLKNIRIFLRIVGIYFVLLGLRYLWDGIVLSFPTNYKDRIKRKIRLSLPVFIECFIPYMVLNKINDMLRVEEKNFPFVKKNKEEKPDLEVFVHVSPNGFNRTGHVDLCFEDEVISYGNYDESSRKYHELIGDGVVFFTRKEEYIPFCIEHSNKTLFVFGLSLSKQQKENVQKEITKLKQELVRWYCPLEELKRRKASSKEKQEVQDYASVLYRRTKAKFYKFQKGKYKTYFVLGTNCCLLADRIIGKSGIDLLKMNGLITPGTYYEYLNREFQKKGSNVISRSIYNEKRKRDKMKEKEMIVTREGKLLEYLIENTSYAKNKCKSLLKYENVLVNGKVETKYDFPLKKEDSILITNTRKVHAPFRILYEDQDFLIVHKKERLLTSSPNLQEHTLYQEALRYLKAKREGENLYVVHRLDKETSGIVLFVKQESLAKNLQDNWNQLVKVREYTAVVEGLPEPKEGTLKFYLQEHQEKNVTVTDKEHGKLAVTNYQVKKANDSHALLQIQITTGRKNQIRASFSHIGHPIVGDKKYYAHTNPIHRVALASTRFVFLHPVTKKEIKIEEKIPKEFLKLVK